MEYIRPKKYPDELAIEAYESGHYIEAIQLIHGWLENQAQQLILLVGSIHFDSKSKDIWDTTDSFSFNICIKILFVLNQITQDQFSEFREFNSMRNKIIHQIFTPPREEIWKGIPKDQFDKVFNRSIEQVDFFTRKCEELV